MPSYRDEAPLRTAQIGDRTYELRRRKCSQCDNWHYGIMRWRGLSFAHYIMPDDFEEGDFESFVSDLDDVLLMRAPEALADFKRDLDEVNSQVGIHADYSYSFKMLEYGRQRASILSKLGYLDALIADDDSDTDAGRAIRAAFELGMAVAEHRMMTIYEDYVWAGVAQEGWRLSGLPKAREERLRHGKRTRTAIVAAAKKLYTGDASLLRNDSETARRIRKLGLPELDKGNGTQISIDAITRHLRSARLDKTS